MAIDQLPLYALMDAATTAALADAGDTNQGATVPDSKPPFCSHEVAEVEETR